MKISSRWLCSIAVFAMVLSAIGCVQAQWFESPLVGKKAPGFTLTSTSGKTVQFEDVTKDKNAILFFWSTWCPHCREQIEALKTRKDDFAKQGIEVVLIDIGEGQRQVESFLKSRGLDFDVLLDTEGAVSEQYEVLGIPTIVLVDSKGYVRDVTHVFPEDYAKSFK